MSIVKLARPEIQELTPYGAAAQVKNTVRLNANEVPWTRNGDTFRRPLNRYPEVRPARLGVALAEHYGCAPDNLLVTRGTSEGIDLLIRAFCRAGIDSVATPAPTFSMYRHYAKVQGARLIEIGTTRDNDFAVDVDALLAACDDSTRLVFLCSPNNPTGNLIPRDDLIRILEARRDRSAVVVDEAYIEFSDAASTVDLLDQFDNLIVLRTLSKALACAGARCGSVIGSVEVIDMLAAVQAPYALATPVVESVENALQSEGFQEADKYALEIVLERDKLMAELRNMSFVQRVWPSAANFFLIEVQDVAGLLQHCSERNILLRYFGGDLADCIRITVGSREENKRLLMAFNEKSGN
ncbi:MAG: histidinol-phosphate transaminase [Woeseiaceae bacterium]